MQYPHSHDMISSEVSQMCLSQIQESARPLLCGRQGIFAGGGRDWAFPSSVWMVVRHLFFGELKFLQ